MILVDVQCDDSACDEIEYVDVYFNDLNDLVAAIGRYVPDGWRIVSRAEIGYPIVLCPEHAFEDQEFLHDPETGTVGDCWRAGIASVLGRPIAEVPHFVRDYPSQEGDETARWFAETRGWLLKHHQVEVLYYDNPDAVRAECRAEVSVFPHILIDGRSPRGDFFHVVVGDAETGEMVHDPHPDRTGLREITGAFVLVREATES
ncbi:hypothetical protein ORI20_13850 [Mycobacterium sp. CVI_P3]|uniref:Peptidase C39-like domain-containing protein n=1 Tax=Mycobacterium pinniadriaticum TaxID=2994102 RepID=A0ABT3SE52_9MYCO|nr:hypothetical protein [Mycobacterium pinniadriaticum]MCX2931363.1 hypothetical protein [Mycobacterium pinniadriaticum]MCX2937787.1 hypothetical protein [Mycobacterium pinniadriaticum]